MKKRIRRGTLMGSLALALVLTLPAGAGLPAASRLQREPIAPHRNFYHYRQVELIRVVDGDTLRLTVDLGFGLKLVNQSFRLLGVDAPELNTEAGKRAKRELKEFLRGQRLELEVTGRDSFGRWLCVVWAQAIDVNTWLVEQGLTEEDRKR
jgi:micrococcal nuclease